MIYVSDIESRLLSALDAADSGRYDFTNDFKPAINYSQEWLVSLFNSAFSSNKLSEESLKELLKVGVFRTSNYSRVAMGSTDLGCSVWTLASIFIDIEYVLTGSLPATSINSVYVPNASYLTANYQAKRTTLEKSIKNKNNPFEAGNNVVLCEGLMEYAYINFADYTGGYKQLKRVSITPTISTTGTKSFVIYDGTTTSTIASTSTTSKADICSKWKTAIEGTAQKVTCTLSGDNLIIVGNDSTIQFIISTLVNASYTTLSATDLSNIEIEILPEIPNELIAIAYLKYPTQITGTTSGTQYLEFPESLTNLVTNKALQFISYKQGDNTNLYGITRQDIKELVTLMS